MKVKGPKVKAIYLTEALAWPKFPSERTVSANKYKGLSMIYMKGEGVMLLVRDQHCMVPLTAIKSIFFEEKIEVDV